MREFLFQHWCTPQLTIGAHHSSAFSSSCLLGSCLFSGTMFSPSLLRLRLLFARGVLCSWGGRESLAGMATCRDRRRRVVGLLSCLRFFEKTRGRPPRGEEEQGLASGGCVRKADILFLLFLWSSSFAEETRRFLCLSFFLAYFFCPSGRHGGEGMFCLSCVFSSMSSALVSPGPSLFVFYLWRSYAKRLRGGPLHRVCTKATSSVFVGEARRGEKGGKGGAALPSNCLGRCELILVDLFSCLYPLCLSLRG